MLFSKNNILFYYNRIIDFRFSKSKVGFTEGTFAIFFLLIAYIYEILL